VKEFLEKIVRIFTTPINIDNHDQKYQRSSFKLEYIDNGHIIP
jgi:hypothetical protein